MPAQGYTTITDDDLRKLRQIEGNSVGTGTLPALVDQALSGGTAASAAAAAAQATANAALPAAKLVVRSGTVPAGSATPTATVSGLLTTDTILAVDQIVANANSLPLIGRAATCAVAGQLALVYSANPGANGTISVLVKTA